jgi:uncharacterized delta-60 repeat protein
MRWSAPGAVVTLLMLAALASGSPKARVEPQIIHHPSLASELALPLPNARILLGGPGGLVALRADGSVDRRFGRHGLAKVSSTLYFGGEEFGDPVAVDGKGRILLVGNGGVRRLLPDGRPDTSFGSGGMVQARFGAESSDLTSVVALPDGKIILGGAADSGCSDSRCSTAPALERLTESGNLDRGFGKDGVESLTGHYLGEEPRVIGLTAGRHGEVFAVTSGYPPTKITVQRIGPGGKLDSSFGKLGSVIAGRAGPPGRGLFLRPKIAVLPSGEFVVCGQIELHSGTDAMVAFRFLADGRPDPTFGRSGFAVVRTSVDAFTDALAVAPDGEVLLAGDGVGKVKRYFLLAALRSDGTSDQRVGKGGVAKLKVASNSSAAALLLRGNTAIEIGSTQVRGMKGSRTLLARFRLPR